MASVLGKRKARSVDTEPATDVEDAAAIFRRHFESQFKPLQAAPLRAQSAPTVDVDEATDSEAEESEWDGISEDDDDGHVQVIDYTTSSNSAALSSMTKREMKAFMSSRPPLDAGTEPTKQSSKDKPPESQDEDSATFLANDLALQRLISESKILSDHAARSAAAQSTSSTGDPSATTTTGKGPHHKGKGKGVFAEGRLRVLTTDMRLRALGGRESVLAQSKMPMAIRRGITGAAAEREARRRKEARENGIVLERETAPATTSSSSAARGRRRGGGGERAVDLPAIGRLRGAELKLSKRDIRSIEGGGRGGKGELKKRRRRR